jgi:hypothetical protein
MFEKVPAVTMNNRENFSTQRSIFTVRHLRRDAALYTALSHFPSYLRLFDIFFEPLIPDSQWGAAPSSASCCGQFSTAQAHVAFL